MPNSLWHHIIPQAQTHKYFDTHKQKLTYILYTHNYNNKKTSFIIRKLKSFTLVSNFKPVAATKYRMFLSFINTFL